jgi:hypothetical protein
MYPFISSAMAMLTLAIIYQSVSDSESAESLQRCAALDAARAAGLATTVPLPTIRPLRWLNTTYWPGVSADSSMIRLFAVSRSRTASTQTSPRVSRLKMS